MTEFAFDVAGTGATGTPAADVGGEAAYNAGHAIEALNHLIEYYRIGPRNQAFMASMGAQLQELEDAFWDLYTLRGINTATGVRLDYLGKLVGELRFARVDDDYRAAIKARVLVNSSDGKIEQLFAIIRAMLPDAVASLVEQDPAAMIIEIAATYGSVQLQTVADALRRAKAAGVRLDLVQTDTAGALLWETDDFADDNHGWGQDDDATVGGEWTAVV